MQSQSQKSPMLAMPSRWQKKYVLKRIGDKDINISLDTRNEILRQLANNGRFVQIGEYTIMLNAIKSIDPVWGTKNTPPRPKEKLHVEYSGDTATTTVLNKAEIEEWDSIFLDKGKTA